MLYYPVTYFNFQAVMCSRLGGRSIILGNVGNDDNGKAYIENFKVKKQLKAATEKIISLEF